MPQAQRVVGGPLQASDASLKYQPDSLAAQVCPNPRSTGDPFQPAEC